MGRGPVMEGLVMGGLVMGGADLGGGEEGEAGGEALHDAVGHVVEQARAGVGRGHEALGDVAHQVPHQLQTLCHPPPPRHTPSVASPVSHSR